MGKVNDDAEKRGDVYEIGRRVEATKRLSMSMYTQEDLSSTLQQHAAVEPNDAIAYDQSPSSSSSIRLPLAISL